MIYCNVTYKILLNRGDTLINIQSTVVPETGNTSDNIGVEDLLTDRIPLQVTCKQLAHLLTHNLFIYLTPSSLPSIPCLSSVSLSSYVHTFVSLISSTCHSTRSSLPDSPSAVTQPDPSVTVVPPPTGPLR